MIAKRKQIAWTKIGISVFVIVVALGPLYTVDGYSVQSNLISELGAQQTQNNFLMIFGFLVFGGGLTVAGILNYNRPVLPFMLFGVCMALVGLFSHKPLDPGLDYNALWHDIHGALATVAGVLITIGFVWQGILLKSAKDKSICFYLGAIGLGFPMLMLSFPEYQGVVQRLMYLQVFVWLWTKYPNGIVTNKQR